MNVRRQCQKIRMQLADSDVMVGTTEEFQGQERRVIIVTTVRSNPEYVQLDQVAKIGFLKEKKRFNVAITRSQALLIVIGNPNILYQVLLTILNISVLSLNINGPSFRTLSGGSCWTTLRRRAATRAAPSPRWTRSWAGRRQSSPNSCSRKRRRRRMRLLWKLNWRKLEKEVKP